MSGCCKNKSSKKEEIEKIEKEKDVRYPVEDISTTEKPDEENVKEALEELNPTIDSLGKRGANE